jgi:hypothetical protein
MTNEFTQLSKAVKPPRSLLSLPASSPKAMLYALGGSVADMALFSNGCAQDHYYWT